MRYEQTVWEAPNAAWLAPGSDHPQTLTEPKRTHPFRPDRFLENPSQQQSDALDGQQAKALVIVLQQGLFLLQGELPREGTPGGCLADIHAALVSLVG